MGMFEGARVKREEERLRPIRPRTYVLAWAGLFILTVLTVSLAGRNLGRFGASTALVIAGIKSGLILNYFMHLKYEKGLRLIRWIIPSVLVLLLLFIGLTFFDVAFR